jgi:HEAT repeat protein
MPLAALNALEPVWAEALPHFLPKLLQSPNAKLRWKAAKALGKMGTAALPQLLPLLEDPDDSVRRVAVEALEDIGSPALPHLLSLALRLPDSALGKMAVASVAPHVLSMLHLPDCKLNLQDLELQRMAVKALRKICRSRALCPQDTPEAMQREFAERQRSFEELCTL